MYQIIAFLNGLIFGAGLTVSNMTDPNKVLNFLDITGDWDPTLLVVMASALLTTFIGYRLINRCAKPVFAERFYLPEQKKIDGKLLIGSALFGIGWGIAGYCPGPAITALATMNTDPLYMVAGLIAGSYCYYWFFLRNKS
ncbi:DUF6691 family protein [Legionella spiritensis]|uniref:Transporter protein n=1 Tax=Legionella spiritensis TaxID=452 RepID=A0A0W0Z508_LEGSP|nr:DUF6691 family protein [Legionella spiritensis]KTD63875.1 hypothetical protein Lspi_1394 [Legionella spiritensis]SNV35610.1 transporter protein [Legionella spiritensis]